VFLANEDYLQTKFDPIGRFVFFGRHVVLMGHYARKGKQQQKTKNTKRVPDQPWSASRGLQIRTLRKTIILVGPALFITLRKSIILVGPALFITLRKTIIRAKISATVATQLKTRQKRKNS